MTTIPVARSVEALDADIASRNAKLDDEIQRAKAGTLAQLSQPAALRFLGISRSTLYRMIQAGDGPPHVKRPGSSRSQNERLYFPFNDLKTWQDARTHFDSPEVREQHREEAKRNALRAELAEMEARAASLRKALRESGDRRIMAFDSLASAAEPHPWIFDGERLLGHALVVSDDDLEDGELVWLSLDEALLEEWVDLERHEHFTAAYVAALNQSIQRAESHHKRLRLVAEVGKHTNDRAVRRDL